MGQSTGSFTTKGQWIGLAALMGLLLSAAPAQAQGRRQRWRDAREKARAERKADKADQKAGKVKAQPVHGGKIVEAGGLVFEVVLLEKEIRVYALREGKPYELKGAKAKVTIGIVRRDRGKRANHQGSSASLRYVGKSSSKGRLRGYLGGSHKLGKADRQAITMNFTITSVPKAEGAVTFEVSGLGASAEVVYRCETCSTDKKPRRFLDPGTCPKCKNEVKAEASEKAKGASFGGRRK